MILSALVLAVMTVAQAQPVVVAATWSPAVLTYPTNNATGVDTSKPFTWTAVAGAQAYSLYVGTTVGSNNLVNSGETLATSYSVPPLPLGQTLYARLYTKANNSWANAPDVSFVVSSNPPAHLLYPTNGSTNVSTSKPFTWNSVPGVQAYYLYVGTSPGATDIVNSGETLATSFTVPAMPLGPTIYARLYTKANNAWANAPDVGFVVQSNPPAHLLYPTDGSAVDGNKPFTWTSVPSVQAYYLYVGTTAGSNNLVNSGEIVATSYSLPPLPVGPTLYARLYTKANNSWAYPPDVSFTVSSNPPAHLLYPGNGSTSVNTTKPFSWTPTPGAGAFSLYVGTSPGASDLYSSGETLLTSLLVPSLPLGQTLYARLYTKANNVWASAPDVSFVVTINQLLTYPINNAPGVDTSKPLTWNTVPGAQSYYLYVGTSRGASDLVNSGETSATSYSVPTLPVGATLWARLWVKWAGNWIITSDVAFQAAACVHLPDERLDHSRPDGTVPMVCRKHAQRQGAEVRGHGRHDSRRQRSL